MTDAAFDETAATADVAADPATPRGAPAGLPDHLQRVRVEVEIVLGHLRMPLAEIAALREGAVLALDRKLGDWVDVAINGRVVARGEVIALDDEPERLGVAMRAMSTQGEPASRRRPHA